MAERITKYLAVSSETHRLSRTNLILDRVAWDDISNVKNLADYDHIYLNLTALFQNRPASLRERVITTVFNPETWAHIIASDGLVCLVGDCSRAIQYLAESGPNRTQGPATAGVLQLNKDNRELDYRRTLQNDRNNFGRIYKYLDSAAGFKYSMTNIQLTDSLVNHLNRRHVQLAKFETICRTSYSTFLAAQSVFVRVPSTRVAGALIVLPSLNKGIDAEDLFVLQQFFGIATTLPAPDWLRRLKLPEQEQIEGEISAKESSLQHIQEEITEEKSRLDHCKRWYRLLYDDGQGLEEIVKEAFELLGASVSKTSKEKEDYRLVLGGFPEAVIEIKGTHNPKFTMGALRQLAGWMDGVNAVENKAVKGVFIGNAGRNDEPQNREKLLFEPNCDQYAQIRDIVTLSSGDLFCLSILSLMNLLNSNEFWMELFQCKGAFNAKRYWDLLPEQFKFSPVEVPKQ